MDIRQLHYFLTLCGAGIIHFFAQYQKVVQLADVHGFLLRMFVINKEYRLFRQL